VAEALRDKGSAGSIAFATIGDPNVYSTFTYLAATVRALLPAVEVTTVPGITAMQDLAARSGTVLVEGTETLALLPFTAGEPVLAEADIVIWARSLVHQDVLADVRPDAEVVDSALHPLEGILPFYERAARDGLLVARIHSGDPALWGGVIEQIERCRALGL